MADTNEDRLWQFALGVYGVEGVAAECLEAQQRFDADTCLLLAAAFAARQGARPDLDTLALWNDAVRSWRDEVVKPIRAVRDRLKPLSDQPEIAAIRKAVLAVELQGERHELAQLGRLFAAANLPLEGGSTMEERVAATLARAISLYTDQPFAMPRLVAAACRTGDED